MNCTNFKNTSTFFSRILYTGCVVMWMAFLSSCSLSNRINKQATAILLKDSIIATGHIGISIYEPATNNYWYQYDATKYFVPASNVKLFTLFAAMKYLGDSLTGLRYQQKDSNIIIYPTGDPTFLHPDFKQQFVFDFLNGKSNIMYASKKYTEGLGSGWAWDDYLEKYMVQRSEFPMYGNIIRINKNGKNVSIVPKNITVKIDKEWEDKNNSLHHTICRKWDKNELFTLPASNDSLKEKMDIPLVANWFEVPLYLQDTLHQPISLVYKNSPEISSNMDSGFTKIYSQPTDSLLLPMLHNSDNFFAEQCLVMVSNEHLGYMNVDSVINNLLQNDLKDLPQKPRWVDGSGLSRYNLFTPQSFIYILQKLQQTFGIERLKRILPTGGEGNLKNFFRNDSSFIFAKTGTMSNHSCLTGILYTKKGKLLLFSVLANQFIGSASKVRHSVERFLEVIRDKY